MTIATHRPQRGLRRLLLGLSLISTLGCSTDQHLRQRHETRLGLFVPELLVEGPTSDHLTVLLTGGRSIRFRNARAHQDGVQVIVDHGRGTPELGRWALADVRAVLIVDQSTSTR